MVEWCLCLCCFCFVLFWSLEFHLLFFFHLEIKKKNTGSRFQLLFAYLYIYCYYYHCCWKIVCHFRLQIDNSHCCDSRREKRKLIDMFNSKHDNNSFNHHFFSCQKVVLFLKEKKNLKNKFHTNNDDNWWQIYTHKQTRYTIHNYKVHSFTLHFCHMICIIHSEMAFLSLSSSIMRIIHPFIFDSIPLLRMVKKNQKVMIII